MPLLVLLLDFDSLCTAEVKRYCLRASLEAEVVRIRHTENSLQVGLGFGFGMEDKVKERYRTRYTDAFQGSVSLQLLPLDIDCLSPADVQPYSLQTSFEALLGIVLRLCCFGASEKRASDSGLGLRLHDKTKTKGCWGG